MKISLFPIFLSLLLAGSTLAYDSKAQDMLQRPISIKADEVALKNILTRLERLAKVDFVYSPNTIPAARKVSLNAQNQKLAAVLESLLKPLGLTYQVISGQIVIQLPPAALPASESNAYLNTDGVPEAVDRTITGTVTAENDEGLPGVSVVIKNTTRGTSTDMDGKFRLSVPDGGATLVFSFVGYENQEVVVGNQSTFAIQLVPDLKTLEEVVVVGYGTMQKKDLTGAVASIQGDAITTRKTTQISQALQGAVPGVTVTRNNSAPGATATIRVRGITTISDAGSNPLIILDGVPIDDINSINPNDVDNISVLKDAASASIYGSRAAAGVILITTKRAKTGQLSLDYTAEYGFEKATRLPDYVNAKRYMQLTNELRWNDNGNNANEYPTYPKDLIDNYDNLHAQDPDQYPNTDWRSLMLKDYAPRRTHLLSISGSGKSLRSRVSLGYDKTDALYDGRSYERITARVNNDLTITKYLSASVDFNFRRSFSPQPITDDRSGSYPFYKMGIMPPVYAATFSDGRIGSGKDGANIYARLKNGGFNNAWYNQVGGKISLDFTPIKGLKITGVLSPFFNFDKVKVFTKKVPYTLWNSPNTIAGYIEGQSQTRLDESRNDSYRYTTQALANYTRQFGDHNLNLLGGYEYFYAFNESLGASRGQYILNSYPYLNLGPLDFRDNSGSASENAYRSWFGRVMYGYKDKYLLQANIRYDASSRFASAYRWGSFPSVSAGWVISEEPFLKTSASWLSFLKFRASWGTLGNERIGSNFYPYQAILNFENSSLFYQGNTVVSAQSAAQFQYAIRDITWETTSSYNLGLDVNFFRDRLRVTADYFKKTTRDMLLELEIPDYVGFDNPFQNTGKMYTTGWDMQASWNDRAGDLTYSASVNLSDFKSVMGDLGGTVFTGDQIIRQGSQFREWYGYVSDGLFQTADEVANSPKLNANVKPGDVRYRDISGPNGVPDGRISPEYDRVLLGGSLPRLTYGANFNVGYKNWDFGLVLQGVAKQNSRLGVDIVQPLRENFGTFPAILDGNAWSTYNTADQNLQAQYPRYSNTSAGNNYALSDYWLINGGYFRLKNISLGYNIPKGFTQKLKMQSIRVYSSVTDLLSISKFPKGWDPEMTSLGYPITTSFVFGASVKF
ncbi:TonB-dependent receptor [Larkinella sp. C7]|uniref:TonB-dependent receptor n=1 Tax=Larkinella sp. C7 TaxID=2576607 RepID=UPI00111128D4|nr:TonB-dependent receptor [Larkinella sp. C7]